MPKKNTPVNLAQTLGHDMADKRLDILRRIGESGSISEAARSAGVSYKAAWQALETLSNLAGTPLVDKAVGGSGGGGARLTNAGHEVLKGAALLAQARTRVLRQLQKGVQGVADPVGLTALGLRTSMRNHLPCRVHSLQTSGTAVLVTLDLGAGQLLRSRITQESVELLGLAPGLQVLALCKATAVHMAASHRARQGSNRLQGTLKRHNSARRGGEVSIQLESGQQLVGFAEADNGLKVGAPCVARIDESSVVIGLLG